MSRTKILELLYFEVAGGREVCFMHSLPVTLGHSTYGSLLVPITKYMFWAISAKGRMRINAVKADPLHWTIPVKEWPCTCWSIANKNRWQMVNVLDFLEEPGNVCGNVPCQNAGNLRVKRILLRNRNRAPPSAAEPGEWKVKLPLTCQGLQQVKLVVNSDLKFYLSLNSELAQLLQIVILLTNHLAFCSCSYSS